MLELILGQFLPYIVGSLAVLAGLWGYGKKRERDGRRKEIERQGKSDRASAERTKELLDEIDNDMSPVDRLRAAGRLRD